jgi:hypothetical protein
VRSLRGPSPFFASHTDHEEASSDRVRERARRLPHRAGVRALRAFRFPGESLVTGLSQERLDVAEVKVVSIDI